MLIGMSYGCEEYALALMLWQQGLSPSTMSAMDSWRRVTFSREQEDARILRKFTVAIQHQGSFEVLKKVHIVPDLAFQAGVVVFVDLRFLFACDLMTNDSFPDLAPCWSPQETGLVCPCCSRMVP